MRNTSHAVGTLLVMLITFGLLHTAQAEEPAAKMPEKYSDAIAAIEYHSEAIDKAIKGGKLDTLHKFGDEIKMLAQMLPMLAAKSDSGVPEAGVKAIKPTSKKLADAVEPLYEAGDAGKKDEAQKAYSEIVTLVAALKK
jgi:hypothetical protein